MGRKASLNVTGKSSVGYRQSSSQQAIILPTWIVAGMHLLLLYLLLMSFLSGDHISSMNGDLRGYMEVARDIKLVALESWKSYYSLYFYPPLANITFLIADYNRFKVLPYDWGLLITNLCFALAGYLYIVDILSRRDARWVFFAILLSILLLMPSTFFARYEFFTTFLLLLSALSVRRGKTAFSGFFLGAAVMMKFAPLFFLPVFLALIPRGKWRRFLAGFGVAIIVPCLLYEAILGPGATFDLFKGFFAFRAKQSVYIFSTFGSIDFTVARILGSIATVVWLDPNLGHFVMDFPSITPTLLQLLSLAGEIIIAIIVWKDPLKQENILLYIGAAVFWLLFSTSFCNMHYYLWGLPFVFLWLLERAESGQKLTRRHAGLLIVTIAIALLGQFMFPYAYYLLMYYQTPIAIIANLLRNLLVFAVTIACLKFAMLHEE